MIWEKENDEANLRQSIDRFNHMSWQINELYRRLNELEEERRRRYEAAHDRYIDAQYGPNHEDNGIF